MHYKRVENFKRGLRVGIPIGLGYFAVSIALGIAARNAGFERGDIEKGVILSVLSSADTL